MGSLSSAVSDITSAVSTVKSVVSLAENIGGLNPLNTSSSLLQKQQNLAMKQLQAKQNADLAANAAAADIDRQELAIQTDAARRSRADTLRRALAAQRAGASASGIAPDDGSSLAVQQGLFDSADAAQGDADQLTGLKTAAIDQSLTSLNNQNLLARTQLAQKQKLQRIAENY